MLMRFWGRDEHFIMNEPLMLMTQKVTLGMLHHLSSKFCLPRQELIQEQCRWRNAGGPEKFVTIIIFFYYYVFTLPVGGFLPGRGGK